VFAASRIWSDECDVLLTVLCRSCVVPVLWPCCGCVALCVVILLWLCCGCFWGVRVWSVVVVLRVWSGCVVMELRSDSCACVVVDLCWLFVVVLTWLCCGGRNWRLDKNSGQWNVKLTLYVVLQILQGWRHLWKRSSRYSCLVPKRERRRRNVSRLSGRNWSCWDGKPKKVQSTIGSNPNPPTLTPRVPPSPHSLPSPKRNLKDRANHVPLYNSRCTIHQTGAIGCVQQRPQKLFRKWCLTRAELSLMKANDNRDVVEVMIPRLRQGSLPQETASACAALTEG